MKFVFRVAGLLALVLAGLGAIVAAASSLPSGGDTLEWSGVAFLGAVGVLLRIGGHVPRAKRDKTPRTPHGSASNPKQRQPPVAPSGQGGDEPADSGQLEQIRECHGILPPGCRLTEDQADRVIEYLENHLTACPHCGSEVYAAEPDCFECGRDLDALRVPVKL